MKEFFKRYSYESVHLLLNQVAIGLFGLVLALAAGMAKNETLRTVTSAFAVVFYLFLQFAAAWRIGWEDRSSIELGKKQLDVWVPLKVWLLASSLNLLLALCISLSIWFNGAGILGGVGGVASVIKNIIEGMYTGLLALKVGGVPLNTYWFIHFLTSVPTLIVVYISYMSGVKGIAFGGLFSPYSGKK